VLLNATAGRGPRLGFASPSRPSPSHATLFFLAVADVNGDGPADLVVATFNGNTLSYWLNPNAGPRLRHLRPSADQQTFAVRPNPSRGRRATGGVNANGRPEPRPFANELAKTGVVLA